MTVDLVDRVRDALLLNGHADAHVKRLDSFTGKEGICIRRLPSTTVNRYIDRSRTAEYVYQVVVRRRSERAAMDECCDIADLLDGMRVESGNGSYRFSSQEVYTEPQELELDEANFYAWHVRMVASIEI